MSPDEQAVPADPESEACYEELAECVRTEIQARVAFGDDPHSPGGQQALAEMISDSILDYFQLRPRAERRYRR